MSQPETLFEDVKVLELAAGAAGPVVTRYLADHGATVIRVESRKRPDFLRTLAPDKHGINGSPMFVLMNPGQIAVTPMFEAASSARMA